MKEAKEIDADKATLVTRDYFEKGAGIEAKSAQTPLAEWMCLTIASVEKHDKHFLVKCEIYEDPSSSTKSKYRLKISKKGEVEEVSKETKKGSTSSSPYVLRREPHKKTKAQGK